MGNGAKKHAAGRSSMTMDNSSTLERSRASVCSTAPTSSASMVSMASNVEKNVMPTEVQKSASMVSTAPPEPEETATPRLLSKSKTVQLPDCSTLPEYTSDMPSSRSGGSNQDKMLRRQKGSTRVPVAHRGSVDEGDGGAVMMSRKSSDDSCINVSELDAEARSFLTKVMENHFLFSSMDPEAFDSVFSHLKKMPTYVGQVVFEEAGKGDSCYFIRSGVYSVTMNGAVVKEMRANQTFGELALLYSTPRSATVICAEEGELWRMDRPRFVRCMDQLSLVNNTKALTFFSSDPNFRHLSEEQQKLLAQSCSVQRFMDGQEILREGDVANWVYIIISGKVAQEDNAIISGSVVGSVNLVYGKQQTTSVWANGNVICLSVGKYALFDLSPEITAVFRRNAIKTLMLNPVRPLKKSMFPSMTDEQLHRIIGLAEEATIQPNQILFTPEDDAQLVLIIDGEAVLCKNADGSGVEHKLTDGMSYGEQEVLQSKKMGRYLVATAKSRVHRVLHSNLEKAFGEPVADAVRCNEVKEVLQDIFLFKNLKEEQIEHTVRRLQQQKFKAQEIVCRQGDPAKHFFLIQEGTIVIKKDQTVLRTLGAWDYFGERGVLLHETRSATCQAVEACICLVLDADDFYEIVGMFKKELLRRMHLQDLNIKIEDLHCKSVVGRGTFGTVRLVHAKSDDTKMYALKGVKKIEVVKGNQQKSIVMEREVNKQCYHPCIMQFIKTFQDKDNVYFLTEFLGGGDLFYAIREIGYLTKLHTQFFSGTIVLALEYLHARSIMYRDLKPENVLLDFNGAAKLVDFGCCKREVRTHTLVGTPDYMAPEVIKQQGYTCVCDWWSLGVMLYEFIVGPLPFGAEATDQMSLFKAILKDPLEFPDYVNDTVAKSLLSGLLERRTEGRLGSSSHGAKEIKLHEYYDEFNWDALGGGFHEPPHKPDVAAITKNWEESDGDLVKNVGSLGFKAAKGMEWAKGF